MLNECRRDQFFYSFLTLNLPAGFHVEGTSIIVQDDSLLPSPASRLILVAVVAVVDVTTFLLSKLSVNAVQTEGWPSFNV